MNAKKKIEELLEASEAGDGSRTAPQRFAGISASLLTTTSS